MNSNRVILSIRHACCLRSRSSSHLWWLRVKNAYRFRTGTRTKVPDGPPFPRRGRRVRWRVGRRQAMAPPLAGPRASRRARGGSVRSSSPRTSPTHFGDSRFWQADERVGVRGKQSELGCIGEQRNGSSSARFPFYASVLHRADDGWLRNRVPCFQVSGFQSPTPASFIDQYCIGGSRGYGS